ncbi:MAG: fumarate hydratase [Candidatus Omnitrophota bacterium]|nr:fumarate hydratase [Candidatus Omnitrophota bacterium]
MREISADLIKQAVAKLCIKANLDLRSDVLAALKRASARETRPREKEILKAIIDNAAAARREHLAVCQDTGMPVVFVDLGQDVHIRGDLRLAINKGVELGYKKGYLRNSIIGDPLFRGKPGFAPAVIHTVIVKCNKIKLTVLPKGFGCENKSQLKMFKPTADISEIKQFIVDAVKSAGPDACPPYIVGVGIGGTADYASLLAKKALLRKVKSKKEKGKTTSKKLKVEKIEAELLKEINALNIGPMGLGGKTTALAVNIETYPTHIAGLPVAINISCHALRSATVEL